MLGNCPTYVHSSLSKRFCKKLGTVPCSIYPFLYEIKVYIYIYIYLDVNEMNVYYSNTLKIRQIYAVIKSTLSV